MKRQESRQQTGSRQKAERAWWSRWFGRSERREAKRRLRPALRLESLEERTVFTVDHEIGDHIHPFLKIIVDGAEVPIPSNIGITSTGDYSPHTHDATGKLHIGEGLGAGLDQAARYVTLKDFFDVWRTTNVGNSSLNNPNAFFSSTQLMNKTADATHSVFMTVNGVANTEFENYIPEDNDQIVLSYGLSTAPPTLAALPDTTLLGGSPLLVPLDGYDPSGGPLTFTVTSSNPAVTPTIISGTTSWRMDVDGFGQMVFQLLPGQAQRPVDRVVTLTNQGFYDGLTFHRIINNFVIQGGDPAGNGTGGSSLGNFDDQFNVDLQHNRTGLLSYAKSSDDTNNSQFFITEGAQRHLDFNHSIFGVLVEGESVRDAISNVSTNASNVPLTSVVIDRATTYVDTQNAVLMLKAPEGASGTSDITVTVRDANNNTFSRTFRATITPDTVNGGPFLNDIPAIRTTTNTPVNFTLTSQDVEGNAVQYTAVKGDSLSSTVTVNATTGVVTATPPANYVGTMLVNVTVRAATGQPNNTADLADAEQVAITVAPSAPTGLDLPSAADTGSSTTDNITNVQSFSITVNGVTNGATVKLYNGTTLLGQATSTGTSVTIPLTNQAAGSYSLTATQTISNIESDRSAALPMVIDTTAPVINSTAPTTARVGEQLSYNVGSPEEGTTGFRYELVNAPSGMVIDATTGVLTWTPTAAQSGAASFSIRAIDLAGNSVTQNVSVTVAAAAQVRLRLAVTDANGNPLTSLAIGQAFQLRGFAQDLRSNAQGVYAAYLDVTYDSTMASVTGAVGHGSTFTVAATGSTTTAGLIDEVGGASASFTGAGENEVLLFTVPMTASKSGTLSFASNEADLGTAHEVLVFGSNTPVATSTINYGTVSVQVASSISASNDTFNVNEDSANTTLTVLANDSAPTGTLTITSVGATNNGGTVTIAADSKSVVYRPAANFFGADIFTYTVTNGSDSATATATVTVQPVNDPPTAVADSKSVSMNSTSNILDVLANDLQTPDSGETLRVTAVSTPTNGTASVGPNGAHVVYSPRANFTGTETLTYTLSDGNGGTSTGTVTITVANTSNAPSASSDTATVLEDSDSTTINVLANDSAGAAGGTLSVTAVGTTSNGGTVSVTSGGGSVTYKPAANYSGTETFTYTLSNGTQTATGTVTVTVTNVNDPPNAVDDTVSTAKNLTGVSFDVLANDVSTPDPTEVLTISAVTQPSHGTVSISADGKKVLYTPTAGYTGADSFTYTVRDPGGLTDTATVSVTVRDFVPSSLSGYAYIDINNDGVMQSNEKPLSGVTFTLTGTDTSSQSVTRTVTTDATGKYAFTELPPGTFTVAQTQPSDLRDGKETVGSQGGTLANNGLSITLAENTVGVNNNFGELPATRHVRIHDYLARTRLSYVTAAVDTAGAAKWSIPGPGWSGYSSLTVQNSSTAGSLQILATPTGGTAQQATIQTTDARVRVLGTNSGVTTYRIYGAPAALNLQAVTTNTNSSGSGGEGEAPEDSVAIRDALLAQLASSPASNSSADTANSGSAASNAARTIHDLLARRTTSASSFASAVDSVHSDLD
ncbi:MAG: tandem-95 repeat protein [Pirellulales bacterium]